MHLAKSFLKNMKKHFVPNGLVGRFCLIILLPLIIVQFSLGMIFYNSHWDKISHRLARDIYGEIELIANVINRQDMTNERIASVIQNAEKSLSLDMYWKPDGTLPTRQKSRIMDMNEVLTKQFKSLPYPHLISTSTDNRQHIYIQLDNGTLEVVVARKRFFSSTVWVFFWWMVLSSLLWFGVALIFMKNQLRAIIRLANAAELFGIGKDVNNFRPEGATEVRHAGTAFLLMKTRLQRYLSERTAMLAGVSHDLRTPLTRLKLQLSLLPQDENTRGMEQDVNDMENMLNGYLAFARGDGREESTELALNPFLTNLVDKFKKTNHSIDLILRDEAHIIGRPTDLSRAIGNLIANAGRYATKTWVKIKKNKDIVQIIIDDNGAGIPKKDRENVFKPFVRLEESRNRETGGVGLGLPIARDILLAHGGDITLDKSPQKGLRVVVSLPIYRVKK